MPYRAPLEEYRFLLDHVVDYAQIAGTDRFCEASSDLVEAVLSEALALTGALADVVKVEPGVADTSSCPASGSSSLLWHTAIHSSICAYVHS